jgi:hypothetical protein
VARCLHAAAIALCAGGCPLQAVAAPWIGSLRGRQRQHLLQLPLDCLQLLLSLGLRPSTPASMSPSTTTVHHCALILCACCCKPAELSTSHLQLSMAQTMAQDVRKSHELLTILLYHLHAICVWCMQMRTCACRVSSTTCACAFSRNLGLDSRPASPATSFSSLACCFLSRSASL